MPDRHHHVPLVLLRNFAPGEKIWLYDKHESKSFKTNIRNAFVEGNYNTVVGSDATLEAEQIFGRAEDLAAPVLQSILLKKDVHHLTVDQHAQLATFVTIQRLRSKQSRKAFTLIREHMQKRFPGIPQSNFHIEGFSSSEADKYASLDFIVKNLADLTQHVANKDLVLVELTGPGSFWISDHPVILHNDNPTGVASNRGFAVAGVQIYLPISPSYAIAFFCPTLVRELEDGVKKIELIRSNFFARSFSQGAAGEFANLTLADMKYQQKKIESHLVAMRDERKIKFNKQNLLLLNSSQVLSAHRFIGSCDNRFSLVADMLRQDPKIREPSPVSFG